MCVISLGMSIQETTKRNEEVLQPNNNHANKHVRIFKQKTCGFRPKQSRDVSTKLVSDQENEGMYLQGFSTEVSKTMSSQSPKSISQCFANHAASNWCCQPPDKIFVWVSWDHSQTESKTTQEMQDRCKERVWKSSRRTPELDEAWTKTTGAADAPVKQNIFVAKTPKMFQWIVFVCFFFFQSWFCSGCSGRFCCFWPMNAMNPYSFSTTGCISYVFACI